MIDAIPLDSNLYDVLIVFQVKSHRMLKSTLLLADAGYGVEGEMFLRSMQEQLITVKYLLLDPDRHAEMYRTFRWIEKWKQVTDQMRGAQMSLETGLLSNEDETNWNIEQYRKWLRVSQRRYDEVVQKRKAWATELRDRGFKHPRTDSWSFKSNYDMARDTGLLHVFLNLYGQMSDLVHPSTLSVFKYIGDSRKIQVEPGNMYVNRTMVGAVVLHTYITQLIAGFYEMQPFCDICDQISVKLAE